MSKGVRQSAPEARREGSPGRKPWVGVRNTSSPGGAKQEMRSSSWSRLRSSDEPKVSPRWGSIPFLDATQALRPGLTLFRASGADLWRSVGSRAASKPGLNQEGLDGIQVSSTANCKNELRADQLIPTVKAHTRPTVDEQMLAISPP